MAGVSFPHDGRLRIAGTKVHQSFLPTSMPGRQERPGKLRRQEKGSVPSHSHPTWIWLHFSLAAISTQLTNQTTGKVAPELCFLCVNAVWPAAWRSYCRRCFDKPELVVCKSLELVCRRNGKSLSLWAREVLSWRKQNLTGRSGGCLQDGNAEKIKRSGDEVSEGNKILSREQN